MTRIKNRSLRPRAHRFALESRQLFDGAALAETAAHNDTASDLVHHASIAEQTRIADITVPAAAPDLTAPIKGISVIEPSTLNAAGADAAQLSDWQISATDSSVTVTATLRDSTIGTLSDGQSSGTILTMTGTADEAQAWLNSLTFKAADVELGNNAATSQLDVHVSSESGDASGSMDITVTPSNDPVTVADNHQTVAEIGSTAITDTTLFAVDPEVSAGTQFPVQIVYGLTELPKYGYLTLDGDRLGIGSVFTQEDVINGSLVYVHTATGADQNTADGFVAVVNDGATPKDLSGTVHITLDIAPLNQLPSVGGSGLVYEGQPANAVDTGNVGQYIVASTGGDPQDTILTIAITSLPTHGTLYYNGVEVTVGQTFDYADRSLLTYKNDGSENQGQDSFGVRVTDQGGGTGVPGNSDGVITLRVQDVDDDPTFTGNGRTPNADVPSTGTTAVTLTADMLSASDVDSGNNHLSFITDNSGLTHGYLTLNGKILNNGGTFTMADILAGKVQYVQYAGASTAGQTDSFNFVLVDNTMALRWNDDGSRYNRAGGIYDPGTQTLTRFTFTLGLVQFANGSGIGTLPTSDPQIAHSDSSWAGAVFTTGDSRGQLNEGGSVTLNGTNGDFSAVAGMSYTATDVDPSQVVYTFLGFSNGATGGEIQRKDSSGNWVTVGAYGTFIQADLDAGNIRFQHDGGETFFFAAQFAVSAGLTKTDQNGYITQDIWTPTLNIYVTPVNDLPVVTGSSTTVIAEGETAYITTGQLSISDPDDANSGSDLESSATLRDGVDNYAYNNGAGGGTPLKFEIDSLPTGGTLQYYDGSAWKDVTVGMTLDAALLTASTNTTGLRFVNDGSEVRKTDFTVTAIDRWSARSASSGKVTIQITNVNDAPQIAKNPTLADPVIQPNSPNIIGGAPENNPLYVKEGSYQQITSALLQAYDSDSSARQVQYTITSAPAHGNLAYSTDGVHFSIIGAGGSFTQQDVIDGHIYYLSDGSEGSGRSETSTPNTPDDKFTFRLSDGDKEQSGNEFWIYTLPTNDAPIVSAPSGVHNITSENPANNHITGFSVSDPDLTAIITGETDYLQVTVRLLDRSGNALTDYTGVTLGYDSSSGAATAITHSGQNDYLVLSGTYAQVNAALAGLTVTFTGDRNTLYQVQVIADDRLRDASGALVGGANGGSENQSNTPGKSQPGTISSTEYNWYSSTTVAEADKGNISMASVWVRASTINDPGTLTITTPARTALEDQATFIGGNITLSDVESTSFGTPVTVTITVAEGTLGIGGSGTQESVTPSATGSQQVTISGDDTGTLVLTGRASDIQALLNDTTLGLTWTSPLNTNHDLNGAAPGDVTVTLHLDDGGSHIGDTAGGANPADATLDVTIVPVNDAPTVSADSSTAYLNSDRGVTNGNAVSGFVISDPDYTDGGDIADGESDFMQVTVRITDTDGTPLAAAFYNNGSVSSIIINSGNTQSGVTLDTTFDGNKDALVIRGTLAQVNAYLADLQVSMTGSGVENADKAWHVEVIADDRMRDLTTGALLSAGNANGGENDANGNGTQTVPTTVIDPYAALPAGLTQNVAIAARTIFPSSINDPATITVTDSNVSEGVARVKLPAIAVADPDADVATLQATITLPSGFTFSGLNSGDVVTTDASGHQTLALSGTLSELNARLANLTVQLPTTTGVAATDWNGSFSVTVVVNDNGNHGSRPSTLDGDSNDPGSNPGDISYADATSAALITTRTFTVTVVPVNDAPGLTKTTPQTLAPISEDSADATIVGDTVDNLFGSYFQDTADNVDNSAIGASGGTSSDSFWGVAINSLTTNSAQGSWQYSTDGGSTWTAIGTRTDASSLLLDKTARVRFVPAANFFGTPAALTVRLVETNSNNDTTSTTATPTSGLVTSTATNGGTSRYSARTVTLSTSITGVNDRPVLTGSMPVTMVEDTPQAVTLGSLLSGKYNDDTDNQSAISGGGNASGAAGFVAITGNNTSTSLGHWEYSTDGSTWQSLGTDYSDSNALVLKTTSQLRFVPLADYNGTVPGGLTLHAADTSTTADAGVTTLYAVQDLQSAINQGDTSHWSNAQTVTLTITAVADAKNDAASTHSGTPVTVDVMANDTFSNSDKTLTSVTQGARGSVSIVDGKVLYTPNNSSYVGSDTFTYTVTSGGVNEIATVTITMTNSAPVVASEHVSVAEDNSLSGSGTTGLLYNDSDPDGDTLTVTTFKIGSQTYNAGDTATIAGKGTLVVNANGSYTFTPLPDWNGTVPQVTYTVSDGRTNGAVTTTLDITVTPVADTHADTATTHAGVAVTIDVLANDTFSNPDRYLSATTSGLHGTTTIVSGKVIYTPTTGYVGTDTFTYTVSSSGVTETGTVTVTMTNNAPVTQGEQVTTAEDTVLSRPATSGLLINDSDPDGDPLSVVSFSADGHTWSAGVTGTITGKGTLVINSDGSYTFTPVADWNGSVPQVTYTVSDGRSNGLTTATLDITVTPVVDIHDDSATTHAGVPVTIDVLSNDTFSNSNKTLTATTDGQHGTVTIQSGKVIYTPTDASYVGSDTFTYTVTSGGIAETATVSVTMTNSAPVVADRQLTTPEDTALVGTASNGLLFTATDSDNDTLTVVDFTVNGQRYNAGDRADLSGKGSLTINSDGSYRFTPVADWNGALPQVTYTVTDGRSNGTTSAILTLSVTPVADAHNDTASTHAGVPVTIDVLANDTFSNADKAITATTDGQNGTVAIQSGKVVYTPTDPTFIGTDTFTYTVTSGGINETATVTVTVGNSAPELTPEQATTPEDTPLAGAGSTGLLAHASDPDNDAISVTRFSVDGHDYNAGDTATLAGKGTLTINSDGSYLFTPVADWNGALPQVTYTVSDGLIHGDSTTTLDLSVTPVVDATADSASTHAGTPVTIDVLANDTFSNSDKAITATTDGQHGTVAMQNGQLVYTPSDAGYVGTDTFTYTVTSGGVNETTHVTVTLTNSAPAVPDLAATTAEDTPLVVTAASGLLHNATDSEHDALTVSDFSVGSQTWSAGTQATLAGVGELTINSDGSYRFTPVADWNGTAPQVIFTVSDGRTNGSTSATLNITVTPVADARDDSATTHSGVPVTIDVLGNDTFSNADKTLLATTDGQHGAVVIHNGQVIYTPADSRYVGTDTFTYTVRSGGVEESATVTVTMTNSAPVLTDEHVTTPEDTPVSGPNLLANDTDAEGDTLTLTGFSVDGQHYLAGDTATLSGKGTLTINSDGSYLFTPVADWNGALPQVTYSVTDGRTNGERSTTLDIAVLPVADAVNDSATTHAGTPVTIDVLANDSFSNSDKTITATTNGQYGTVAIENGRVVYTPTDASYVGSDAFTYTVTSGGIAETATVVVTLTNAAPVLTGEHVSTPEDTPLAVPNLLANDHDPEGDPLTITGFSVGGQNYHPGETATLSGRGTLTINSDGSYLFTPVADWNGSAPQVTYTVSDGRSNGERSATLDITVTPVTDAFDDTASTHAGTPVTIDVRANDSFSNADNTITAVTPGQHGSVAIQNGKVVYTPSDAGYVGSDTFTYTVTSGGVTETATVTVTLTNSAPQLSGEHVSTPEDTAFSGSGSSGLLAHASDADNDALSVTGFSVDGHSYNPGETALISGKGTLVIHSDGHYLFTPVADWNGDVPQVTWTVSDGRSNGFSSATLDIHVLPVADAIDDSASTHAGVPVTIDVLGNDTFSNADKTLSAVTQGQQGTVTISTGKVVYTPTDPNYLGTDTFTYTVTSGGITETATVTVTISNTPPVLTGEQLTTPEDTPLSGPNLLANDYDADGDALTLSGFSVDGQHYLAGETATLSGKGTLTINRDGSYLFTPVADWNGGVPQVTYEVTDGHTNGTRTTTLDIRVLPVIDAFDDAVSTHSGVPVSIDALNNDTFSNSDKAITATTDGQHGTVTLQNGKPVYTPTDPAYVGSDTFTYTVTSGGIAESATVTVTLVNAAPELASAHVSTPEDTPLAGQNLLANARDPDGDPLTLTGFQVAGQDYHPGDTAILVGQGSLVMNSDGSYLFTPIADWHGDVSPITWTVSDGRNNGESTATLTITVTPVADANPDSATTHAGVPVVIDVLGNDTFSNPDRTLSATTNGQYGTVTINNGQVVYTPTGGYVGNDTFSYTVTSGGVSETTSVTVTLTNAAPVTQSEQVTTPEDTPISGPNLLNNDHDAEGDPLTITGFSVGGLHYQAGDTATLAGSGTLTINSDGSYHFVPVADWHGDVPQVIYSLSDGRSNGTVTATLDIRVTPVMDSHDDSASTHANTPVTIDVLANDTFSNPDRVISGATNGQHGTVVIEDGKARYTPNNGYVGTDTFTYTVTSGGVSETAVVTLDILNTPPVAMTDKASTLLNTPLSGNVLANDSDAEHDVLHVTSVTVDGVHYVPGDTIDLQGAGTLVVNSDGSYRFTPATGWSGFVPTVSYTISDGNVDGTSSSELHLLVSPIGEAWVKEAGLVDSASGTQTTSGTLSLLSLDAMESLTIGGHTLTLAQLTALSATQPFDIVTPDGVLSLTGLRTLDAGHAQLDYRYTLSHAIAQPGFVSTQEDISLSVNGEQTQAPGLLRVNIVNDVPVAQDDSNSIDQDRGEQIVSGNLYANDRIGADGTIASGPLTAVSSVNLGHEGVINGTFKGEFGELTLDANGNYRYVADRMNLRVSTLDPLSTLTEVFVYTLTDADGNTSQARLSIVIHGTTPPLSKQGDEIFPHDRRQEETALDQPYTPGLFILPAIYGIYSDRFTREVELNRKVTELGRGANDNATPVLEDAVLFTRWVNTTLLRSPTPSGDNHDVATQQLASRFNPFTPKATGKPTPADVPAIQEERVVHGEATKGKPVVKHDTHENLPPQANISIPGVVVIPAGAPRPGAPGLAEQIDKLARNHTQAPEPITVGGPVSTR